MVDAEVFERIALTRLPELQVASGLFRATARVEGVEDEGPAPTTLRAGAVVLLGLLRADMAELAHPFPTGALRTKVLGDLGGEEVTAGDLGLAMWAESRADGGAVSEVYGLLQRKIGKRCDRLPLDELAWIVSGLTEAGVRFGDSAELDGLLTEAADELCDRVVDTTGLLNDVHRRRRGAATPIGSQFHALGALYRLSRAERHEAAGEKAAATARAVLALQRPDGAWPGLVDPQRGEPVAIYPALTVTQVALAPMTLRLVAEGGLDVEFGDAAARGIEWADGGNKLGFDLVHETEARLDRGILPKREPGAIQRGISNAARRLGGRLHEPDAGELILDPAVSSEDLGWVLEAWAGR